jgi:cytochrome-b5 reductase
MIAGGTGITPMLQIIRAIQRGRAAGDTTEVDLIFANVNPEDILLKEDLDALAKKDKGIRVYYVLNNPPEKWDGGVGFVTAEMIKVSLVRSLSILFRANYLSTGAPPTSRQRHQDSPLRPSTHDLGDEEGYREPWLPEGQAREQAGGSGLRVLDVAIRSLIRQIRQPCARACATMKPTENCHHRGA